MKAVWRSQIIGEAHFISPEYWQKDEEYGEKHVQERRTLQHGVLGMVENGAPQPDNG